MYNQQINEFISNLIIQGEEHTNCLVNIFSCLKGYFSTPTEKTNTNISSCKKLTQKEQELMKLIRKRNDGRWEARKMVNGKSISFYARTQLEVLKKIKIYFSKKQNTDLPKKSNTNILFINWLIEWHNTYKKNFVSKSSNNDILNIINKHLKPLHKLEISEITTYNIQTYLNNIKPSRTKEKICIYLNASLEKAKQLNIITTNPFNAVVKDKKINNVRKPFTYDEQAKVLKAIENEDIKPVIYIYFLTGLRKNELDTKNLFNNINYENKFLKAVNLKQRTNEPTYKYIDLSENFIQFLYKHKNEIIKLNVDYVSRKFSKILKELNITGSLHTLRHCFATNHMYLGTPDKIISSNLGHSTTQITKDIYTELDRTNSKEKIINLFDNLYYIF